VKARSPSSTSSYRTVAAPSPRTSNSTTTARSADLHITIPESPAIAPGFPVSQILMSIPEYVRTNFNTPLRAADDGNLVLLECTDVATGEPRYVITAMAWDGTHYVMAPFGHLHHGDPWEAWSLLWAPAARNGESESAAATRASPEDERESDPPGSPAIRSPESPMTIDGIKLHPSVTEGRIVAAVEATRRSLENPGICITCGADAEGVEPDARQYECESCGEPGVYGAEELVHSI
jgi:Family of unknown function (DUF6117)